MLSKIALVALSAALVTSACGSNVVVRTVATPEAHTVPRQTFRILHPSVRHNGNGDGDGSGVTAGTAIIATDPMLDNSITNLALRDELRKALIARGYREVDDKPDLDIAYYSSAGPALDISTYYYGYDWAGCCAGYPAGYTYEQGTVLIDAVDPTTHKLLWRGQGVANVSSDPSRYKNDLRKTVDKIVKQFPPARP
jgi:Domain of unknown function (DUF4136)